MPKVRLIAEYELPDTIYGEALAVGWRDAFANIPASAQPTALINAACCAPPGFHPEVKLELKDPLAEAVLAWWEKYKVGDLPYNFYDPEPMMITLAKARD